MSGIARGIKKVFKKVGNVLKKVAVPLLVAGAIVFTGGAALGLAPMAGGWGGAVAAGLGKLGIAGTGVIGSTLTGAVTQAGYGAAIGGAISAATGGDFMKGATAGALTGAVTGGIGGALSAGKAAAGGVTMSSRGGNGLMTAASGGTPAAPAATPAALQGPTAAAAGPAGTVPGVASGLGKSLATGFGKFLESPVAGQMIAGGAQGLMTGMQAKDEAKALKEADDRIYDSYAMSPAAFDTTATTDGVRRPSAREKYEGGRPRYRFDRERGEIVYG